ncbi:MAG: glycerophosphodiester phosphodiesterase family protein [Armatimonadota bacterium]
MRSVVLIPLLAAALSGALPGPGSASRAVTGYLREVPPESEAARAERLRRVAERRAGPVVVMVHRGASAAAPENSLEAYSAALDLGADGCEVDVRRTADGVLVLFHDDMLDRLTNGFGTVPQLTYYELLSLKPRLGYGAGRGYRVPTFAALLELARRRAMLLHLDVKEPGLDAEIARMLDQARAWEHVVGVNVATAPDLARDPRVKPLAYKGPGLFEGRRDLDPEAVRAQLARPGAMVMVDDPRLVARELGRKPAALQPLPRDLTQRWEVNRAAVPTDAFGPSAFLRQLAARVDPASPAALLRVLSEASAAERTEVDGSPEYACARTERIVARAWAAQRLGELGKKTPEIVRALEQEVRGRSLHRDWMYHGLDGAAAARTLGELGAVEAVPTLVDAFRRVDPALKKVANPEFGQYPLAWTDFRARMTIVPALGELRSEAGRRFLLEYVRMDEAAARELGPPMWEEATRALFRHRLSSAEVAELLRSRHSAVRGAAILECLDRPSRTRTAALKAAHPWAAELPRITPP